LSCDNYRGVSLLSHCGKVMTSVILQRIRQRTDEILSEAQAGFRVGCREEGQCGINLVTKQHVTSPHSSTSGKMKLKCLSFNARNIMNNKLELFSATVYDLNLDLIGITESWATRNVLDAELSLSGYQLFRRDRSTENRGGVVLLYVRDTPKAVEYHMDSQFAEHVWCQKGSLVVGVTYSLITAG